MADVSTFICSPKFVIEYTLSDGLKFQSSIGTNNIKQVIADKADHWLDLALKMARDGQPILNWQFTPNTSDLPGKIFLSLFIWLDKVVIRLSDQPIESFFFDSVSKKEPGSDTGIDLNSRPSDEILNKFSQLNSELTAIQRELQKKNKDLEEVNSKLHYLATTDFLTGIYNRREVLDRANLELERAKRENHYYGLALIDFDKFKEINDTHGHLMGDEALIKLASLMQSSIRGYDAAGRIGGDEFLISLSLDSKSRFQWVLDRLQNKIRGVVITTDDGLTFKPTVSIGAVCFSPSHNDDIKIKDLLIRADEALYQSKDSGGDQITLIVCDS